MGATRTARMKATLKYRIAGMKSIVEISDEELPQEFHGLDDWIFSTGSSASPESVYSAFDRLLAVVQPPMASLVANPTTTAVPERSLQQSEIVKNRKEPTGRGGSSGPQSPQVSLRVQSY